jgi:hypothetical protein
MLSSTIIRGVDWVGTAMVTRIFFKKFLCTSEKFFWNTEMIDDIDIAKELVSIGFG